MDSSVSTKDEIWFLRVCHHISNAFYKRQGGLHGRFGRMQKISSPRGSDPLSVQSVAGCYNDYAIRVQFQCLSINVYAFIGILNLLRLSAFSKIPFEQFPCKIRKTIGEFYIKVKEMSHINGDGEKNTKECWRY